MRKILLIISLFLLSFAITKAQNFEWVKSAGGSGDDYGFDIAVDASGNSYVIGDFSGTASFSGTVLTSSGGADIFIAKYDNSGNLIWIKSAGGSSDDSGLSIAVDASGNSYVTGYFSGTASFSGTTLTSSGGIDIFIAKYDSNGSLIWVKNAGGSYNDSASSIAVDASGNSYVTGHIFGTASFSGTALTSSGKEDIFIAKYDSSGNLIWVRSAGGSSNDFGLSIAVDASGDSYITGNFSGTASFSGTVLTSSGGTDFFIAKYDSSGSLIWVKSAGGSYDDAARGIAVDASGNSYVTGNFSDTASFSGTALTSSGIYDFFIAKYDSSGNLIWVKSAGGSDRVQGTGIAVDVSGNSYVTGRLYGTASFSGTTLISTGSADIFIAKYDSSGNLIRVKRAGGSNADFGLGIAVDVSENIYVTGFFGDVASFSGTALTSSGGTDIFITKIRESLFSTIGVSTRPLELDGWPEEVPNGNLVLDAANKGLVLSYIENPDMDITDPVPGMMVYDTTEECVKLYRGTTPGADTGRTGWHCIKESNYDGSDID